MFDFFYFLFNNKNIKIHPFFSLISLIFYYNVNIDDCLIILIGLLYPIKIINIYF